MKLLIDNSFLMKSRKLLWAWGKQINLSVQHVLIAHNWRSFNFVDVAHSQITNLKEKDVLPKVRNSSSTGLSGT